MASSVLCSGTVSEGTKTGMFRRDRPPPVAFSLPVNRSLSPSDSIVVDDFGAFVESWVDGMSRIVVVDVVDVVDVVSGGGSIGANDAEQDGSGLQVRSVVSDPSE